MRLMLLIITLAICFGVIAIVILAPRDKTCAKYEPRLIATGRTTVVVPVCVERKMGVR